MFHNVAGDERDALLRADDRFELRPLRLQPLAAAGLFAFGHFLEADIDLRSLVLVEGQLGKAALVVDRDSRLVLERELDDARAAWRPRMSHAEGTKSGLRRSSPLPRVATSLDTLQALSSAIRNGICYGCRGS